MSERPSPPAPAEKHGASCGQLHCAVCTAHLANPNQRYCSARCRSRARTLRRERLYCARCGSRQWVTAPASRGPVAS
jgi:hypothetical protein